MIYLNAEIVSGLGEDTFWTWFRREFPNASFGHPWLYRGKSDVILRYSTLGRSRYATGSVALLWELLPEMKEVFQSNEWDKKIAKTHTAASSCRYRVVASPLASRFYEHHGPVDVLPIGVNTDLFKPMNDRDALRRKYGIPLHKRVGIWIGTTHPMKGFARLLQYRNDNPNIHWIIVWKQPSESSHLDGATEFTLISQQTIADLFNCSDFFLCCGMLRSFYMVEWEAMAANLPMLILDGMKKDFEPSNEPRKDIFRLQWDRPSTKKLWTQYLERRFPGCTGEEPPTLISQAPDPKVRETRYFVSSKPNPRVSISALIYRSPSFADWVYDSVHKHTPMLGTGEAEFFFIANDPTDKLVAHLNQCGYPHYVNNNPSRSEDDLFRMGIGAPEYIHRVYRGWNEAVRKSRGEIVVLINSDNFVSPDWLENLIKNCRPTRVVSSQLVERRHPRHRLFPTAYHGEFGGTPSDFDEERFLRFARRKSIDRLRSGGAYMPCAFYRSEVEKAGLYPEGNLCGSSFTDVRKFGDADLFERLATRGVEHCTAMDSIVYHLKEGEMDE
jgi:hypothetical protein